jgi:hypothetical protein
MSKLHGAEYRSIIPSKPKHWEKTYIQHIPVPWYGQDIEWTFLNRTSKLIKPRLQRHLVLTPIDSSINIEGFSLKNKTGVYIILLLALAFLLSFFRINNYNF